METRKRANNTLRQKWVDGSLITEVLLAGNVLGSATLDVEKVSATNRARFMKFGVQQRIADGGAVEREVERGGEKIRRTDAEMAQMRLERVTALVNHYSTGTEEWALRVAAAGVDAGLTIMAIMAWKACDVTAANAYVDNLAAKRGIERVEALRLFAGTKQVADEMAKIRAARATVDGDDLIDEAMGE